MNFNIRYSIPFPSYIRSHGEIKYIVLSTITLNVKQVEEVIPVDENLLFLHFSTIVVNVVVMHHLPLQYKHMENQSHPE